MLSIRSLPAARISLRPAAALATALVLLPAAPTPASPALFDSWRGFPTGNTTNGRYPWAAALGDVDGDSAPDVAVAQWSFASSVAVLRNLGDGTFASAARYATLLPSLDVTMGDFNEDGRLDLAASNTGVNFEGTSVSVFPNTGSGTFGARQVFSVGTGTNLGPVGILAADFDGDGHLDLAVARYGYNGNGNSVAVLRGNGLGGFASPSIVPAGSGPYKLAAADLNGDGRPDLAVADSNQRVSVLVNDGLGGFAAPLSLSTGLALAGGDFYPAVSLADVDRDGDTDVLYSSTRTWVHDDTGVIVVFHNLGNGTFAAPVLLSLIRFTAGPVDLATADLNEDGWPDLIGAHYDGRAGDGWEVLLSNGAGGYQPPVRYPGGQTTVAVMTGDVNGDGRPDVLSLDNYSLEVTVHLNRGGGVFPSSPTYAAQSISIDEDAADIDGDGDLDLLVSGGETTATNPSILRNRGDGTFAPEVVYSSPGGLTYGRLRDLNGDGRPDLLLPTASPPYDFRTAMNLGNGTFGPYTNWPIGSCGSGHIDAVDLDGDHDLDVLLVEYLGCPGIPDSARRLYVNLNRGDGTFEPPVVYVGELMPFAIQTGDLSRDGHADVVLAHWGAYGSNNKVSVFLGRGDGTLIGPTIYTVGQGPRDAVIADLNGDAIPDIATGNTGADAGGVETMSVLIGRGDGSFLPAVTHEGAYSPDLLGSSGIAAGDPDRDGDIDLMVSNYGSSDICFYANQGNGTFAEPTRYGLNKGPFAPIYADFTGDGVADLAAVVGLPPSGMPGAVTVVRGLAPVASGVLAGAALAGPGLFESVAPNPLVTGATLRVRVPGAGRVDLAIYDVSGRRVRSLVHGPASEGSCDITWDGRDDSGHAVAPGTYLARYVAGGEASCRKIVVLR